MSLGERLEHRDALGAHGEAIRGVFNIAATEDSAGGGAECSADPEVGIGGVGVFAGLGGGGTLRTTLLSNRDGWP